MNFNKTPYPFIFLVREHCGLLGACSFGDNDVKGLIIRGLEALQHRGQESWGIALGGRLFKRLGLVSYTQERNLRKLGGMAGRVGIGHVRYSTKGRTVLANAHPIEIEASERFYIAHNGTIADTRPLLEEIRKGGLNVSRRLTDTELIGIRLSQLLKEGKDWLQAFEIIKESLNGSFCLLILTEGDKLIAVRDGRGFRPLCLGWHEDLESYVIASESCALDYLGARFERDVEPGEMIIIDDGGFTSHRFAEDASPSHCSFEYTYFAHPSSYLEGRSVYQARKNIGRRLAKIYGGEVEADVVIPIPDSARPGALGFSEALGLPLEEGLMKDRYRRKGSLRSFILPGSRREIVREMIPIRVAIEGKNVAVVDDSIVRATTSKEVARKLKDAGARKIFWLLMFPPIKYPCYMGIDFPTQRELIAYRMGKSIQDIGEVGRRVAGYLGVEFVGYNDVEGLSKGIGLPASDLCASCVTGDYSCLKYTPAPLTRKELKA